MKCGEVGGRVVKVRSGRGGVGVVEVEVEVEVGVFMVFFVIGGR